MVNPSDDAQFASLYGRLFSFLPGAPSVIPSTFTSAIGFCQQNPNPDPCPSLNSFLEFCEKKQNQGKGACVTSVSSQIEFCSANPDKDPCPSLISLNEFCQTNPGTGPCPGINSAIAGSDFCKENPGTSPCPSVPGASPTTGPANKQSSPPPPPSPTTSSSSLVPPSSGSTLVSTALPTSITSTLSRTPGTSTTATEPTTIATTSLVAGNSGNSPGISLPPSANPSPTLVTSPAASSALGASTKPHNKAIPIIAGVVVPIVLIILAAAGFILYKRRKRARDRREWERTHAEIADAVRQIGAPVKVAVGPAWSGDLKTAPDGDGDALSYSYEKSGGMESSTRLP